MEKNWEKYGKHGIFAALFISLLLYTVNDGRARESELKTIIKEQTVANQKFADIIKVDLSELKGEVKLLGERK